MPWRVTISFIVAVVALLNFAEDWNKRRPMALVIFDFSMFSFAVWLAATG